MTQNVADTLRGPILEKIFSENLPIVEPDIPMAIDETYLGTMTELEKRIFSFGSNETLKLEKQAEKKLSNGLTKEESYHANEMLTITRALRTLLWSLIRTRLQYCPSNIGIRMGWVVVSIKTQGER